MRSPRALPDRCLSTQTGELFLREPLTGFLTHLTMKRPTELFILLGSVIPTLILPDSKSPNITIDSGKEIEQATWSPAPKYTALLHKLRHGFKADKNTPE